MNSSRVSSASLPPSLPPLLPPPGVRNAASSTWYGEMSAAVIADRAGDAPLCRPPQRGDMSGVSAAGPPPLPLPPPLAEPPWNRPMTPGCRRLFFGVSHAGNVTSVAAAAVINAAGECVSDGRTKNKIVWAVGELLPEVPNIWGGIQSRRVNVDELASGSKKYVSGARLQPPYPYHTSSWSRNVLEHATPNPIIEASHL